MSGPVRDWTYVVEPSDEGWVWLPAPEDDIAAWAQAVCADLFVTGSTEVELADQLRFFARNLRERNPDSGALWVPDPAYGVLATLVTDRFKLAAPLEQLAAEYAAAVEPGLAPPQVDVVELPAGPAVRARRIERAGEGPAGEQLMESVTHLVAPPRIVDADGDPTAIELVLTWTLLQEGDEFALMADEGARLLRITTG